MSHRSSIPGCGVTFEIVSNIPEVKDHMQFEFTKNKNLKGDNSLKTHLCKKYILNENAYLGKCWRFLQEFPNPNLEHNEFRALTVLDCVLLQKNFLLKSISAPFCSQQTEDDGSDVASP